MSKSVGSLHVVGNVNSSTELLGIHQGMVKIQDDREKIQEDKARILQRAARSFIYRKLRLDRRNMVDRLRFENKNLPGTLRLFNLMLAMILLLAALTLSQNSLARNGARFNLDSVFQFSLVQETATHSQLWDTLNHLAGNSKVFAPLSSVIFEEDYSLVEVLHGMETFREPKFVSQDTAVLQAFAKEFSLVAWVDVSPRFSSGYLLRKRVKNSGAGSDLSCWGWYLDASRGQRLHFGGHDYFPLHDTLFHMLQGESSLPPQEDVGLPSSSASSTWQRGERALMTMVVTQYSVRFYYDLELAGEAEMPRPLTDCYNPSGLLLGDEGLTLGQVRFYPVALELTHIEEIFKYGNKLEDLSTARDAQTIQQSATEQLQSSLTASLSALEEVVLNQQKQIHRLEVLRTVQNAPLHPQQDDEGRGGSAGAEEGSRDIQEDHRAEGEGESPPVTRVLEQGEVGETRTVLDPNTGRTYHALFTDPVFLNRPGPADTTRFLNRTTFPSFLNSSLTLTFWFKKEGPTGYVFTASKNPLYGSICWGVWTDINGYGLWGDTPGGSRVTHVNAHLVTKESELLTGEWRHHTYQFDDQADTFRFFLDGALADEVKLDINIGDLDCPVGEEEGAVAKVTVGYTFPGFTWGNEINLADVRAYVGTPLSPEDVAKVAKVDEFGLTPKCKLRSELSNSLTWRDIYGEGCSWYAENRKSNPNVCLDPEAELHCPLSCGTRQWCWETEQPKKMYYIWDRIQHIPQKSPKGTLCLSDKLDVEKVVEECHEWVNAGRPESLGYFQYKGLVRPPYDYDRQVNISECDQLEAAIDTSCSFNGSAVEEFTEDVVRNGGDFTVFYWVRKSGLNSLNAEGFFLPALKFLSGLAPPQQTFAMSGFNGDTWIDFSTACSEEGEWKSLLYFTDDSQRSSEEWQLFTFVRTNTTRPTSLRGGIDTTTFDQPGIETSEWYNCFFEAGFANAVEISADMLISPIGLVPKALSLQEQQQYFYSAAPGFSLQDGPLNTNAARENSRIEITKRPFTPSQVAVAPPIVFQQRSHRAESCPFDFSNEWIQSLHQQAMSYKCTFPKHCDQKLLDSPSEVLSCAGDLQESGEFFGLNTSSVKGMTGYADFLYGLTDNVFLSRGGSQLRTRDFIDRQSRRVMVYFVLYSPESGTVTLLEVNANLATERSAVVRATVKHYSILEGRPLVHYSIVQIFNLVFVAVLMLDNFRTIYMLWWLYTKCPKNRPSPLQAFELPLDFVIGCSLFAFVILSVRNRWQSAARTREIVGDLSVIPWGETDISPGVKTSMFFSSVEELFDVIDYQEGLDFLCHGLLMLMLARVILATNVHPRLALLTGTLGRSLDDMWHTVMLVSMLSCTFAAIATWRFGSDDDNFRTFAETMRTQFELLFGEFPENWKENTDMMIYTVLYLLIMFVLVLNFILAIIVEAYMNLRQANEVNEIEMEFLTDFVYCAVSEFKGRIYSWPCRLNLSCRLDKMPSKQSVGISDLAKLRSDAGDPLFPDHKSIVHFLHHYHSLWFLRAKPAMSLAGGGSSEGQVVREVETRVAWLLGRNPPSAWDHIRCMSKDWKQRAAAKANQDKNDSCVVEKTKLQAENSVLCQLVDRIASVDGSKQAKDSEDCSGTFANVIESLVGEMKAQQCEIMEEEEEEEVVVTNVEAVSSVEMVERVEEAKSTDLPIECEEGTIIASTAPRLLLGGNGTDFSGEAESPMLGELPKWSPISAAFLVAEDLNLPAV